MTKSNAPPQYVVDFSQTAREFDTMSTQMCFITEELKDHVKAAITFLEYPKTEDEIHRASIREFDYDPDDESPDNADNEFRRRIRTAVVKGVGDIIANENLRDDSGRLKYQNFELVLSNRTLVFKH